MAFHIDRLSYNLDKLMNNNAFLSINGIRNYRYGGTADCGTGPSCWIEYDLYNYDGC